MTATTADSADGSGPAGPAGCSTKPAPAPASSTSMIASWFLWSWGNASVSAVMVTFVFGTYLASDVFGADERGTQWLTSANAIAGIIIAVTAPVIGQRADKTGRRKLWLIVHTLLVVGLMAACFFVQPEPGFLLLGVSLLAALTLFDEFANLNYNAMIVDIAREGNMGRISGIGWGFGYLGGIGLLMLVYLSLIAGEPPHIFGIGEDEALNIRAVAVVSAAWFLIFALPLLLHKEKTADKHTIEHVSIAQSYRRLLSVIVRLWRDDRNTFWFLVSSAIYRDGLSAVFAYGAILGTTLYGITPANVIIFGIAGNVISALGAFLGGWLDDRLGPKFVISASLWALLATAVVLLIFSEERGPITPTLAFWIFGLGLCLFVGPAQASSRGFIGRIAPPEKAGELFGLYATAGRSVSFLAPVMISIFLALLGNNIAIILAIATILAVGLALLYKVDNPREHTRVV